MQNIPTVMSNAAELKEQGIALFKQHDYEAAARIFQQAKDAYAADGQTDMVAEMKVNIGLVHRSLGESQQALELIEEALHTFQDLGDQMRIAQVQGNLGGVYQALNDKERAELAYRQAAEIFKELGEEELYSDTMIALGAMQFRDGKIFMGAATYQIALERKQKLTGPQKILKSLTGVISKLNGNAALT